MTPRTLVVLPALALLVVTSCGDDGTGAPDTSASGCGTGAVVDGRALRVATTVAPITNIVANIAGGTDTVVTGIVPEGTNSHTYEPEPSVAKTLEDADVVFINGLSLEDPTKDLALANLGDGAEVCELGTSVLPESEYIYDFSFPEDGGKPNPHLWTDPLKAQEYAEVVHRVLVARDPANAPRYDENLAAFTARVGALDTALRESSATLAPEDRQLLTYHDAYAYFAEDYGWKVLGAIQPSSFEEPTPREVADLIEQVEETGVPAIFGSEVFPSDVLQQIASETGATYVDDLRDDDLPGAPGDPTHTWMELMRFDYVTMIEALGGDATALRALDTTNVAPDDATYPQ